MRLPNVDFFGIAEISKIMTIYVKALFYISDFDDEQFTKVINKSHNLVTLPRESPARQAFLRYLHCTLWSRLYRKMIDSIFLENLGKLYMTCS